MLLFIVVAVMAYFYKYNPTAIKIGGAAIKQYWADKNIRFVIIVILVSFALLESICQVIKRKFPELLTSEDLKTEIDKHYEEILEDFNAGNITYKDYMSYKKVNCIRRYNKENEIMYAKLRSKQITQTIQSIY